MHGAKHRGDYTKPDQLLFDLCLFLRDEINRREGLGEPTLGLRRPTLPLNTRWCTVHDASRYVFGNKDLILQFLAICEGQTATNLCLALSDHVILSRLAVL